MTKLLSARNAVGFAKTPEKISALSYHPRREPVNRPHADFARAAAASARLKNK